MSALQSISRTYTKASSSQTTYHHCADDDVILDVWKSYLREWTKCSNNNSPINICKPALLLCASHSIPPMIRSEIWFVVSGAKQLMNKHSNLPEKTYKFLSSQEHTRYVPQINKDYERTFVTKDLPIIRQKLQHSLRRMLIGYANYNPDIGYAQGMNMVAAFILRQFLQHDEFFSTNYHMYHEDERSDSKMDASSSFTTNADIADNSSVYNAYARSSHSSLVMDCENNEEIIEEQAFWCFVMVMENITTLFQKKLIGYHKSVGCLIDVLRTKDGRLYEYFENLGMDVTFTGVFIKWFTSLFAYPSFNLNTTQQLWDLWFLHGFDFGVFVKFAFLIFQNHKSVLLNMDNIDIPVFCISSQCVIDDKNWRLKLIKVQIKPLHLGHGIIVFNTDDEKISMEIINNNKLIEICEMDISDTRSEQSYGEYKIAIKCCDQKRWSVWKRYSEFERLHNKLKLLGIDSNCQFPSKSWIFASNNQSLMKLRKRVLNEYIQNVLVKYNNFNNENKGALQDIHEFANYFANYNISEV